MRHLRMVGTVALGAILGCASNRVSWGGTRMPRAELPRVGGEPIARGAEPEKPKKEEPKKAPARPGLRAAAYDDFGLPEPEGTITVSVMARVNAQPILSEEVIGAASGRLLEMRQRLPQSEWPAAQTQIIKAELEQVINRELILQAAQARIPPRGMEKVKEIANKEFDTVLRKRKQQLKVATDEEFKELLAKNGISIEEERRQFERTFVMREFINLLIRKKIDEIDREDLLDYYREHPKEFDRSEHVVWQHIFIDVDRFSSRDEARQHAEAVHRAVQTIERHEAFAPLAEKHSHGPSQYRKGEGEGNERGLIRPVEVEGLVFSLKPGETGPLTEVDRGFHIVRVVEHTPGGRVSFDQACAEIRKKLQNKIFQAEHARIIEELRAKAHIESAIRTGK